MHMLEGLSKYILNWILKDITNSYLEYNKMYICLNILLV